MEAKKKMIPFKPKKASINFTRNPFLNTCKKITKEDVDNNITQHIKKHKLTIHGCKAVNKQLPPEYHRPTQDFDVWAKNPRHQMDITEDELDALAGCDMFREEVVPFQGQTDKFVYRVVGPRGEVVDYALPPPGAKTKKIDNINYEHIQFAKKIYKKIIADPNVDMQRKQKSARDLRRIEAYEKSLRGK